MRQYLRPAFLVTFIVIGFAVIAYNVYLLYEIYILIHPEIALKTRFAYLPLGFVLIIGSLYIYWLQNSQEHLQADNLAQQKEQPRASQQLPRICDLEKKDRMPSLNPEQLYVLQQLFRTVYQIHVKLLHGGYNNFGVFRVIPESTENNTPDKFGYVVKYLKVKDIRSESRAYGENGILRRYPLRFAPGDLVGKWPTDQDLDLAQDDSLGAVYYNLAALQQDSQLQTLAEIYNQHSFAEIEPYLTNLLEKLQLWHGQTPREIPKSLGGVEGEYVRLSRNRAIIQNQVSDMLQLSSQDLISQERINLPFLTNYWPQSLCYNPIFWILNFLEPGDATCFQAHCHPSPIHGDLHMGNILVEQGKHTNIWLIDFPNAHVGRALIDLATLEADVKFNRLTEQQCTLKEWLEFEDRLLIPLKSHRRRRSLTDPWDDKSWQPDNEHLHKAWQFIGLIRERVMTSHLIGVDMGAYFLALLHSTLPVVYRHHTNFQKQCALTSAAWMCDHLK